MLPLDIDLIQAFCILCMLPGSKVQSPWDNLSRVPARSYLMHSPRKSRSAVSSGSCALYEFGSHRLTALFFTDAVQRKG